MLKMEALPEEITEIIFDKIFEHNPQDWYNLRLVCEAWKNIVDRNAARLLKIWCKKCSNEIPMSYLDVFVQSTYLKFPSWQVYSSGKLVLPHIAQNIYVSWNNFPDLVGYPHCTEFPSPKIDDYAPVILAYDVNDKYFAASLTTLVPMGESVVRIYPISDLTHHIREYPTLCWKMNFYTTDSEEFIVLSEENNHPIFKTERISMGKFLVNDDLVPANLPANESTGEYMDYVITQNQCFTFDRRHSISFWHHRLTSNGFQMSAIIQLPRTDYCHLSREITKIRICNSKLIVSASFSNHDFTFNTSEEIYTYQINRQCNGKLWFSDPRIYRSKSTIYRYLIDAENLSLVEIFDSLRPLQFRNWLQSFFYQDHVISICVYAYHVLILCEDLLIVFRGNLRQLMNYAATNTDPGSRCTVIDLTSQTPMLKNSKFVSVIHDESKPKFLVVTRDRVFTIDFIL